ncbi:phage holin family protein [Holophaga foetida]|uniref:phage holin family protein n=1 Tax=Holophaga foetida TaxID=35839 RepID=UPI000247427E|nr:phage holin family protein [Holophaga foetida]
MRTLLRFLFAAVGLLVASRVVPGIRHGSFMELIAVAVILGALNASLGALLKTVAFLPVACTFGCFSLVINGLVFLFAGWAAGQLGMAFQVSGFWSGFFGALITSLVAWFLEMVLLGKEQPPTPRQPRNLKIVN